MSCCWTARAVKTPGRPSWRCLLARAAQLIAEQVQLPRARCSTSPPCRTCRLVNTAIELARAMDPAGRAGRHPTSFSSSDLLCPAAPDRPGSLVAREDAAWDPVLDWARDARRTLALAEGIVHVEQTARRKRSQPSASSAGTADPLRLAAARRGRRLAGLGCWRLAARGRRTPLLEEAVGPAAR